MKINNLPSHHGIKVLLLLSALALSIHTIAAQPNEAGRSSSSATQTGTISGKIFNTFTSQYVGGAEVRVLNTNIYAISTSDGSYIIAGIPPGTHRLTASYTGYVEEVATVTLSPLQRLNQDFNIRPGSGRSGEESENVILLPEFEVLDQKQGSAKAIMDERAAINKKSVVAIDHLGEIPIKNVGEFVKFLPGVNLQYTSTAARGVRINGLDPSYTGIMIDGVSVAGSGGGNLSRGTELDAMAIDGMDSVEVNKTLTADIDAGTAGGIINLKSKTAFDRKSRHIGYTLALTGSRYDLNLKPTSGPREGEDTRKIFHNAKIEYSDLFWGERLGIYLTAGDSKYNNTVIRKQVNYNFANADRGPIVTQINNETNIVFNTIKTYGLNAGLRVSPDLTISLRANYSWQENSPVNRNWHLVVSPNDVLPESTLTNIVTRPNGINTRLQGPGTMNVKTTNKFVVSPSFIYNGRRFSLSGGVGYSYGDTEYKDMELGFFSDTNTRLTHMSWMAQRSSPDSLDFTITQLSGRPWSDPASFNRDAITPRNFGGRARKSVREIGSANVNIDIPLNHLRVPWQIKAGAKVQEVKHRVKYGGATYWDYIGPGTSPTSVESQQPTETEYRYDGYLARVPEAVFAGYPDRLAAYDLFESNPEYFTSNEFNNYSNTFFFPNSIKERISALFLRADSSWNKLRFQAGVRYEKTQTTAWMLEAKPDNVIAQERPDLVPKTIPYLNYQYNDGLKNPRPGSYDNFFFSGGAKYKISDRLYAQLSFSQAILRPGYNNLAGREIANDDLQTVSVPNPALEPETSNKAFAGLQYFFGAAGKVSAGGFITDVKNIFENTSTLTQQEAGYEGRTEYEGYKFIIPLNGSGRVRLSGVEVEYSQQYDFLPAPFNGLGIFASYSWVFPDMERSGILERSGSGGVAFNYKRLSMRMSFTYTDDELFNTTSLVRTYNAARTAIDINVSYRLTDRTSFFINGQNVGEAPPTMRDVVVSATGQKLRTWEHRQGSQWTVGVRGRF